MLHLAVHACLNQVVEMLATLSPSPRNQALELTIALKARDKWSNLAWMCSQVLSVQPFKGAAIGGGQFSGSAIHLLLSASRGVA